MTTQAFLSLGLNCSPALWLREQKLHEGWSFAFDWAWSTLPAIVDVLRNGIEWHLARVGAPGYPVVYVHRREKPVQPYATFCARRFFDALTHADEVTLLHCSPHPIVPVDLLAVEAAILPIRASRFRLVALYGYTGTGRGIVERRVISPRVELLTVDGDRQFDTNPMIGPFYDRLRAEVLPDADPDRLYQCEIDRDEDLRGRR